MKVTKAQREALHKLSVGCEVTLKSGYYTIVRPDGKKVERIWPTTFHGLFDSGAVFRLDNGNYSISEYGRKLIGG